MTFTENQGLGSPLADVPLQCTCHHKSWMSGLLHDQHNSNTAGNVTTDEFQLFQWALKELDDWM